MVRVLYHKVHKKPHSNVGLFVSRRDENRGGQGPKFLLSREVYDCVSEKSQRDHKIQISYFLSIKWNSTA
jgi:hypothetical protein